MPRQAAYVFTGCSHVPETGIAGAGWVVACGDEILFGNARRDGVAAVPEAEAGAALAGVRAALEAFPGATCLLLSTDGNEPQLLPWGALGEGLPGTHDPSGLLDACRAAAVRLAVRWRPGHNPGPEASDLALNVARALAMQARRGEPMQGRTPAGAGWRSRLAALVGRTALNHALKQPGLTWGQTAALTGLDEATVERFLAAGRLRTTPVGDITLASAVEVRDEAEAAGWAAPSPDDFGQSHLDALEAPPLARLHVAMAMLGDVHGVAVARRWRDEVKVSSERFRARTGEDPFRAAVASALAVLARRVGDFETPGAIDVVTTDPWLAKLVSGCEGSTPEVSAAVESLRAAASRRGIVLRSQAVREGLARRWRGNEALGLTASAAAAARVAAIRAPYAARATVLDGTDAALLPQAESRAASLAREAANDLQAEICETLFGMLPTETEARARFEALAARTQAVYGGGALVQRPLLPGPVAGCVGTAFPGGARPCGPAFAIDDGLAAEWREWWRTYDAILAANPGVALREALLRLDPEIGIGTWPRGKHLALQRWIEGTEGHPPFRLHASRREAARAEMAPLLRACGGWPFPWKESVRTAA